MGTYIPPPYPINALHNLARDAALEIQQQVMTSDAIPAMSIILEMVICTQGIAEVQFPNGSKRPLCLNTLIVAEIGDGKTPVEELVFKPMYDYDRLQIDAYKAAMSDYHAECYAWESEGKSIQGELRKRGHVDGTRADLLDYFKKKPVEPRLRRILYQDVSERALRDALTGDGESIALICDEAEIILKGDLMGKWGLLNSIWSGSASLPLDRAGMDFVDVRNPRMSIGMMVQPGVFEDYKNKRGALGRSSGHWARYLVGAPASTKGTRFIGMDERVWVHLPKFHARVTELLDEYARRRSIGITKRDVVVFSAEAKEVWVREHNLMEQKLAPWGTLHGIRDFASKAMEIVGRLAASFHVFSGQQGAISVDTLKRAMSVVEWHDDEYRRLFGSEDGLPQEHKDIQSVAGYLFRRYWCQRIVYAERNEVYHCGPVRNKARFAMALDALVLQGAVWIGQIKTGRRYINLNGAYFDRLVPV